MASGHLTSLPSLSASEEKGRKETTSPMAPHISHPAHTVRLCLLAFFSQKAYSNPHQPRQHYPSVKGTSPVKSLPLLQPRHFYPSEHRLILYTLNSIQIRFTSNAEGFEGCKGQR